MELIQKVNVPNQKNSEHISYQEAELDFNYQQKTNKNGKKHLQLGTSRKTEKKRL